MQRFFHRHFRIIVWLIVLVGAGFLGLLIKYLPNIDSYPTQSIKMQYRPASDQVSLLFKQAVAMLQSKHFNEALAGFHQVLTLKPDMPEALVNMGYALLGLKRFEAAQRAFIYAIDRRARLANAYYGLAITYEYFKDIDLALGAMRSYVHLAEPGDTHIKKAMVAIRAWQTLQKEPLAGIK